jgi:aminoglycoside phosphotransferase family enzyme/predicted kinase
MSDLETGELLVTGLLSPDAYPWPVQHVELIETHMSWVFLTDDRVLKIKRPVRYGFVDHRSMDARRRSCDQEVRVNRRLTSGVYLGVVPIHRSGDRIRIEGEGHPIEWGTVMRRLPADRMLDRLIETGSVPGGFARELGSRLVSFHEEDAGICSNSVSETADSLAGVITSNLDELEPFSGSLISEAQLEEIRQSMLSFTTEQWGLLEARVASGWIRDGHGDLRAEHVCLETNGALNIFDSIEFSDDLRCADVASDLAFLLMDLKRLGREDLSRDVLDQYTSSRIDLPQALVSYYETHRALVRVKVNCLTVAAEPIVEYSRELQEAHLLLDTAFRSSMRMAPFLIVMTGLSGAGKSTVAKRIAWATGAAWIRSDEIRRSLTADLERTGDWQGGAYAQEWTERTYQRMFESASKHLRSGNAVVLDATFLDQRFRDAAAAVTDAQRVPLIVIETVAPEPVIRERMAKRAREAVDPSEATYETYVKQVERLREQPTEIPTGARYVRVDSSSSSPDRLDGFYRELRGLDLLSSGLVLPES